MKHRGRRRGRHIDLPRATMVQRGVARLALAREASPGVVVDANDPRLAVDLTPAEDPVVGERTAGVKLHEKLPDSLSERYTDFHFVDSTGVRLTSGRNDDLLPYLPIQIGKTDSLGTFTEVAQVDLENARVGINGTPTEALHVQGGNILTSHEIRWMDGGLWEGRLSHANTDHRTYAFPDVDGLVWTSGNDGTGSGLDADLLDGLDSTAFALVGHTHAFTDLSDVTVAGASTGDYVRKSAGDWVNVTITQVLTDLKTVDGTGSGLDSDTTDGAHASSVPTASTIPIADGSNKLAAGWISEVLAIADLSDVTAKTGSGTTVVFNDAPTMASYILWTDSGGAAGATGRLQRNGAELSWHNGTAATNLEQVGRKGAANGYASLDGSTKVPLAQISEVLAATDLTGVSATTGAGTTLVFNDTPTLLTPTIASFANATHSHQNAAGGGTLDTAAIASGTFAAARITVASDDLIVGTNIKFSASGLTGVRTFTFPDSTQELIGRTASQTLTNKTLTSPTIGDFSNATHNHQAGGGGGQLDHGLALTGLGDDDHTIYLLATGLREWGEQAGDPSTPAAGMWKLYFKAGGLYYIDDAGTVTGALGSGGGGGIGTVKEANVNVVTSATILDFDGDDFGITDQTGGEALVEINRNTADGIAGLDSDAKVPVAQLPDTFDAHAWSSPNQLTADVNDYAFSGGDANKSPQRIDQNGVWAITGIAAKNGGWEYVIRNVSIHQLRISNENTGSSAANRIITNTGSNILLNPEQMARLIYDDSKQRWIAYPTLYITESNVLLDNNKHSDTTNHACLRGAVIVGNSTPQWTRVSVGTNGQVLGTDGTDTTFRDPVTKISGSSGAAGPFTTWQALTSDAAAITSTTTPGTTVMTTTGLAAGTWRFKYHIIYRSAATTTGLGVAVNHSGTTSLFVASGWFVTSGTTQATGVADQTQATNTGQLVEGKSERVKNTVSSSSAGVDTANVDCLLIYEGTVINSTSGSLELKINTEVASSGITIKAGTNLVLEKVN